MTTDLETLAIALYVKIDDSLAGSRRWGRPPKLTDAELLTLAVMQALLGFVSETRWLRFARHHLSAEFPYLPQQSGYNKRLRAANALISRFIRTLARDTDL
ncbi:IS982 family transposase, partial [Streptomyces sp. NPDC058280]